LVIKTNICGHSFKFPKQTGCNPLCIYKLFAKLSICIILGVALVSSAFRTLVETVPLKFNNISVRTGKRSFKVEYVK
jgi:hypothetical protein